MKKFGKFLFGTITLASIAAGAYYVYKNYIKKDSSDDFDDFEDDFEDFDTEEEDTEETRGYVPINLATEEAKEPEVAETAPVEEIGEEEDLH
ncbi:MAG: hypothetical protein K0R34_1550 [Herbinix sp.]|jgi:hypothetical protein|nr:hypothetical protein [Herbinix sp.]